MERMVARPSENKGGTALMTPFANKPFAEGFSNCKSNDGREADGFQEFFMNWQTALKEEKDEQGTGKNLRPSRH